MPNPLYLLNKDDDEVCGKTPLRLVFPHLFSELARFFYVRSKVKYFFAIQ